MTFGIIPACGMSTRMGCAKLLLTIRGLTVIERVIGAMRDGGVDMVLVVSGHHVTDLATLATRAGAKVLTLSKPTADMRATVEAGLDWVTAHYRPRADDLWLLSPGDFPMINPAVVRSLIDVAMVDVEHSIFVPTYEGSRGHPLLARWRHATSVRSLPKGEGINSCLRRHAGEVIGVTLSDPSVLHDLDTPEDYTRLLQS